MLLVLFKLFFTQISQNSRIFSQARNHIIPVSSHLSVLSCDVAHRFTQIFTNFYLTTTGTTITTHRSKTDLDLCHLCNLCELLYTNGLELTMKNYKFIIDNLWKFTGISVKYKTQIGTNDHKLSKILFTQTGRLIWKFQVQGSRFNAAHIRRQAAGSRFKVPGSKPPPTPQGGAWLLLKPADSP